MTPGNRSADLRPALIALHRRRARVFAALARRYLYMRKDHNSAARAAYLARSHFHIMRQLIEG